MNSTRSYSIEMCVWGGGGGGNQPWPSRSNLTWKSKFTTFWACPHHNTLPVQQSGAKPNLVAKALAPTLVSFLPEASFGIRVLSLPLSVPRHQIQCPGLHVSHCPTAGASKTVHRASRFGHFFSSKSYMIWYWKKDILEVGQVNILRKRRALVSAWYLNTRSS